MTTKWNVTPGEAALIVVDMQNGFCQPEGFMAKANGLDISQCMASVAPTRDVIAACRDASIPIVFTRHWLRPDYKDAGVLGEIFPNIHGAGAMIAGTWDAEITDVLTPEKGDIVLNKQRYSAFFGTNLDITLRGLGVKTLVTTGLTTNVCVESTVRDAMYLGYHALVLEDCMGAITELMHRGSIETMRYAFGSVSTSKAFILELGAAGAQPTARHTGGLAV